MNSGFMLDTNVISGFINGRYDCNILKESDKTFYITYLQQDELSDCENEKFQSELKNLFKVIDLKETNTDSSIFGVGHFGRGKFGASETVKELLQQISDNRDNSNQEKDALMIEAAINRDIIFVTGEKAIHTAMEEIAPDNYTTTDEFVKYLKEGDS